jgi:hypothetical protein
MDVKIGGYLPYRIRKVKAEEVGTLIGIHRIGGHYLMNEVLLLILVLVIIKELKDKE